MATTDAAPVRWLASDTLADHASRRFVAGTAAGLASWGICHPFDTVKARVQARLYPGVWACVVGTLRSEGVTGLYRGATVPALLQGFLNATFFTVNAVVRESLVVAVTGQQRNAPLTPNASLAFTAAASVLSAPIVVVFAGPVEFYKVKRQCAAMSAPPGAQKAATSWRNLYRGALMMTFQRAIGYPSYFVGVEWCQQTLLKQRRAASGEGETRQDRPAKATIPTSVLLLSGSFGGLCHWVPVYPLDVIKTRLIVSGRTDVTVRTVVRELVASANGGVAAAYRGFGICVVRSVIFNAITWWTMVRTEQYFLQR